MNEIEFDMALGEAGVDVPDRCRVCPRLGQLVSELSLAQENRQFLVTSADEAVLVANARAQITVQLNDRYPGTTDEKIDTLAENSVNAWLSSEGYTDTLKGLGALLEEEETTVALTAEKIQNLVTKCPPNGCQLA